MDNGADIEKQNKVCELRNALYPCISLVVMLNQEGHTALYKASYHGQRGAVETLVKAKAEVDGLNKVRNTLLDVHVSLIVPCLWFQCTLSVATHLGGMCFCTRLSSKFDSQK